MKSYIKAASWGLLVGVVIGSCTGCRVVNNKTTVHVMGDGSGGYINGPWQSQEADKKLGDIAPRLSPRMADR